MKVRKFTTPYNSQEEIAANGNIPAMLRYTEKIGDFIGDDYLEPIADVGHWNYKSDYFMRRWGVSVRQIGTSVKNWDREHIEDYYSGKMWGTILFLDSLEHLMNPLFFLDGLRQLLKPGGYLYVNMPQRPVWLWTEHHFHEIEASRCEALFRKAGFQIEKQGRVKFWRWKPGLRPLIRYFYDYTTIYKLRK